jgi:hypothetical protein
LADEYTGDKWYRYAPLDSSDEEIRLLHLSPGTKDEQASVEISCASLRDRPRYLALSYVWGEGAKRTHPISVNGRQLHVTESLLHALEHLRNMQGPDARIPFWVDALCIDQDNDSEKSHQVRLMKKIYSQAYKVLVWLGPTSEASELALAKMRAVEAWWYIGTHANEPVVEGHDEDEKNPKESKNGNSVRKHSNGYEPIMFLYEEHDKEFFGSLEAITNFLENPWWGRAWIAQEVSSPKSHSTPLGNVEVILGRQLQTISFRSTVMLLPFVLALSADKRISTMPVPIGSVLTRADKAKISISRLANISTLREEWIPISQQILVATSRTMDKTDPRPTMEQLLWTLKVRPVLNIFRGLECQNPRDKVYASLPLVLSSSHSSFAPNYELPVSEVYALVVESFIKHEGSLSILADRSGSDTEMPSWVPDYRCLLESNSLCTRLDSRSLPIYRASRNKPPKVSISAENRLQQLPDRTDPESAVHNAHKSQEMGSSVHRLLNIRGVTLDKIKTLAPFIYDFKAIRRPDWEKILNDHPEYYAPTNEPTRHAYQKVLTADVERTSDFSGGEPFATWPQRIAALFEGLEREFRNWIAQTHKNLPSFSILQDMEEFPGPRKKHDVWKRGAAIKEAFFTSPEPSDVNPDTSHLSKAESTKVLAERDETRRVKRLIENTTTNRVFCVTEKGYLGLVPYKARENDLIVVLFGGHTPFVLRERELPSSAETGRRWQLIGECYVHGFMDGEALDDGLYEDGTNVNSEEFVLV